MEGGRTMQIFNQKKKLECLRDFLITAGILSAATGIGFGFYTLGFSEENIIIVYLLGAMIVAVLTASRVWSGLAPFFFFGVWFRVSGDFCHCVYRSNDRRESGGAVKKTGGTLR